MLRGWERHRDGRGCQGVPAAFVCFCAFFLRYLALPGTSAAAFCAAAVRSATEARYTKLVCSRACSLAGVSGYARGRRALRHPARLGSALCARLQLAQVLVLQDRQDQALVLVQELAPKRVSRARESRERPWREAQGRALSLSWACAPPESPRW